ncbi:MAG: hypothetical protein H0W18_13835 [Acidobacteria bacterium]|nr:hypothetical protein [Acidobacteriota bacterium]
MDSPLLIGLHLAAFFACAVVCHLQLARQRPPALHLTEFYLWLSFGGVLGGAFNTLLAPHLFNGVFEYPLVLLSDVWFEDAHRVNGPSNPGP